VGKKQLPVKYEVEMAPEPVWKAFENIIATARI
jgi:hypothetical protein